MGHLGILGIIIIWVYVVTIRATDNEGIFKPTGRKMVWLAPLGAAIIMFIAIEIIIWSIKFIMQHGI